MSDNGQARPPIYLDNQATTRLDPRVLEAMRPALEECYGNASSRFHAFGLKAREMVEEARSHVAALVGARPEEIVFTSGATESNNLALRGLALARKFKGGHIISATTEHKAVIDPLKALQREGFEIEFLPVDREGFADLDRLRDSVREDTILVSLMAANNEIGTLHPVERIGAICRERGAAFHCDAVQAAGKVPIDADAWNVDLLSLSAHKIHGPKGAGALFVRRRKPRARLVPQQLGGGQESGLRAGTLNVAGIVGMGEAARIARVELEANAKRLRQLRDKLWEGLRAAIPDIRLNGPSEFSRRLPNNLNVEFLHCEAQSILLEAAEEIAASPGSACGSGDNAEPSYVLLACGHPRERAVGSIRFGVGRFNSAEEIAAAPALLAPIVEKLRSMSPAWTLEHSAGAADTA